MQSVPRHGDMVYVDLYKERIPAVIISEISGKLFGNPGFVWTVRLIRNNRVFVKAISVFNLSERTERAKVDDVTRLPKLKHGEKGHSEWREYPYFRQGYYVMQRQRYGNARRKLKPARRIPQLVKS